MFCKYCGSQISDDAVFCDKCGKRLSENSQAADPVAEKTEVKRCPDCGETVSQYAQMCKSCGCDLTEKASKKKNKKKRKPMGCLVWAIIVLLIFGSCSKLLGGNTAEKPDPTIAAATEAETKEVTEATETTEAISLEVAAATAEAILKGSYDNCVVSYDDTGFTANITLDGIALIGNLAASGNEDMIETWNEVVDSIVSMSESMTGYFRDCGFEDLVVTVNILNDQNEENIIIMTMNGVLVYDAVADK